MFSIMYLIDKIKEWFRPKDRHLENAMSYYDEITIISRLNPLFFRNIHSSDFSTIKLSSITKTLEEYNKLLLNLLNRCVTKKDVTVIPIDPIYQINISEYFLTEKGVYTNEESLVERFKELNFQLIEWLISIGSENKSMHMAYNYATRVLKRSVSIAESLYLAQIKRK